MVDKTLRVPGFCLTGNSRVCMMLTQLNSGSWHRIVTPEGLVVSGEMHFVAHGPSIGKVMDPRMAGIQNKANCRTGVLVVCPRGHTRSLPTGASRETPCGVTTSARGWCAKQSQSQGVSSLKWQVSSGTGPVREDDPVCETKPICGTDAFVVCPQGHTLNLPKGHQEKRLAASLQTGRLRAKQSQSTRAGWRPEAAGRRGSAGAVVRNKANLQAWFKNGRFRVTVDGE
jgi:hypothetical protein